MKSLAPTAQGQDIMERLNNNKYECVICMNVIRRFHRTWTCARCYTVTHSHCIQNWAVNKDVWVCPVCRMENYKQPKAMCFCGKHQEGGKYFSAHCCGEICGKKRTGTNCPHPCTHKCHAGPCGPCTAGGKTVKCYCGRSNIHIGCGNSEGTRSCGKMCLKELKCGHACISECHPGDCPKCIVKIECKCYCGKETSTFNCGEAIQDSETKGYYSCKKVCGKLLACGKHYCTLPCHSGKCEDCPTPITIKTCACGSTKYNRTSCSDPFEICQKVCGKKLPCGHYCQQLCHFGECKCTQKIKKRCRCGAEEIEVVCGSTEEVTCENVCGDLLSCGIHHCERKCCVAHDKINSHLHQCFSICNKVLPCGHKCSKPFPLTCRCGKTVIRPPVPCGTHPPICNELCKIKPPCGHTLPPHRCHFGDCPQCVTLCEKPCYCGKNTVKNVPCYIEKVSCGGICGKPMKCGVHFCKRVCHKGPCTEDGECHYLCNKEKGYCTHKCDSVCHGDTPCPIEQCKQLVEVVCDCGTRKVKMVCGATPEHPWKRPHLDCNLDCLKELVTKERIGVETVKVKYPLWFLCLYDSCLKASKTIEKKIIAFVNDVNSKTLVLEPMNSLAILVTTYLCGYYKLDMNTAVVKKSTRLMLGKVKQRPVLVSPTAQEQTAECRQMFKPRGYSLVINVIIYDTDYENQTLIIHLTQINDEVYDTLERFLKKIKGGCKQNQVNWKNIILYFEDRETIEYAIKQLKKMNGYIVRDDMLIPEEEPDVVLQTKNGSYTEDGIKIISKMLQEKFQSRELTQKIMVEMPAFITEVVFEYETVFRNLKQEDVPLVELILTTPKDFILHELRLDFTLERTQINQILGYHDDVLSFDMDLYIGIPDKKLLVEWKKR
ncbi:Nuclear transcription factor [Entamoeba marina]